MLQLGQPLVDPGRGASEQESRGSRSSPWEVDRGHRRDELDLLALLAGDAGDHVLLVVEQDGRDAGEHLLKVLLQPGDVLAVANDLQEVLITHEIEPVCSMQCAVCSVQCAVCSVQCAVCSVQCAVFLNTWGMMPSPSPDTPQEPSGSCPAGRPAAPGWGGVVGKMIQMSNYLGRVKI